MSRSVTLGCDGRRPKALTRSEIMSRIKGRDTSPELILRRLLFGNGWRYRVNFRTLAGKVDIAFPGMKVAVQIDGCFWHGCPWHGVMPRNNRSFWKAKLTGNRARDRKQGRQLRSVGWKLLRVWEHAIESDPRGAAERVEKMLCSYAARKRATQAKARVLRGG